MFGFVVALFSKEKKMYKAVKNILGFYPGNIFLYRLAFRHKSASYVVGGLKSNNERLEYLGDSVISTAVAHYLFKRYPHQDEGFLTEMRSKMVSRDTLNKVAAKMGLHEMLNIDAKSGGFKSVDGNALEALMGAVFLDKGYCFTERIIVRRLIGIHIDMDEIEKRDWNYKSKLIDWGQRERCKIHFQVTGTLNQKGKKLYKVVATVNDAVWGEGMDQSIKAAEQIASENAYKNKVIPAMEKKAKKGYREPLPDEEPVSKAASAQGSGTGLFTITASLGSIVSAPQEIETMPMVAEPRPDWTPAAPDNATEVLQENISTPSEARLPDKDAVSFSEKDKQKDESEAEAPAAAVSEVSLREETVKEKSEEPNEETVEEKPSESIPKKKKATATRTTKAKSKTGAKSGKAASKKKADPA